MTNRYWLKREVPAWVKEKLISEEEGKALLARYRKGEPGAYKEAFFVMAVVSVISSAPLMMLSTRRIMEFSSAESLVRSSTFSVASSGTELAAVPPPP